MNSPSKRISHMLEYAAVRLVVAVLAVLGGRVSRNIGRALGGFAWSVTGFRRELVLEGMAAAFPEKSRDELFELGRGADGRRARVPSRSRPQGARRHGSRSRGARSGRGRRTERDRERPGGSAR